MSGAATPRLGVVGLGNMGAAMATRLVGAGYDVSGFDLAGSDRLADCGVAPAPSLADLAGQAEMVLLSLPDGPACEAVCAAVAGTANVAAGVVIDTSTTGPHHAAACAEHLGRAGIGYVDAPVSGGVPGARAGTLTVMLSCDPDTYADIAPVVSAIASNVKRVGAAPGQGQVMKLVNNFLSNVAFVATCEALLVGERYGLELTTMLDTLNSSTGRNSATAFKFPAAVVEGTYDLGFSAALARKDIELYRQCAGELQSPDVLASTLADAWARYADVEPAADVTYYHQWLRAGAEPS